MVIKVSASSAPMRPTWPEAYMEPSTTPPRPSRKLASNGFAPIIADTEAGVYHGGADPRKESVMLGW